MSKKSNSTRLPPRVVPARKNLGKQSTGRRKMVERESAEKERIKGEIESCTERLVGVLSKGGVTGPSLEDLRKGLSFKEEEVVSLVQADSAVDKSWTLASCYPSIDVNELVSVLHELRALLCDSASLASKPAQRKLNDIRSDPKADPEIIETAENNAKHFGDVVTKCNIGAYKTRALQQIASEARST
ncbi:hypothetical protein ACHAXR_010735 [Thalassiosira sp. AJA248-18]